MALNKLYDTINVFRDDTQSYEDLTMDGLGILDAVVGTWTPNPVIGSNLDAITAGSGIYIRIGDMVVFSFSTTIDPTAPGAFGFTADMPIESDFTSTTDAHGMVSGVDATLGQIQAEVSANVLSCTATTDGATSNTIQCMGMYRIR